MTKNFENEILPVGWVTTDIGTVTLPITTSDPKQFQESQIKYLDISGIDNSIHKITEHKSYMGKDAPSRARQLVKHGDVLFSTVRTYLKNIAKVPHEYDGEFASTGFSILRAADGIDSDFLYYFTLTPALLNPLADLQRGSNYPAVRDSDVRGQRFPLPPLPEQKRIVAKIEELFSELDKGIESFKTALEQLKVYRQALLKHAFEGKLTAAWREANKDKLETAEALLKRILAERAERYKQQLKEWEQAVKEWEKSGKKGSKPGKPARPKVLPPLTADELAELPELPEGWGWVRLGHIQSDDKYAVKAGPFGSALKKEFYVANGYKVYGQEQVISGDPEFGDYFVDDQKYQELISCAVKPNDILISLVGTIGKVLVLPESTKPGIINPRLVKVSLNPNQYRSSFFKAYFESSFLKSLYANESQGTTMNILNLGIIQNLPYPLCAVEEQELILQEIESRFSEIDNLDQTITTALQQAETLRQSILKKAFSGQLVPQDPNDEPAAKLLARIRAERTANGKAASTSTTRTPRKKKATS